MQPVAFFCKTFRQDFDRLERMLATFQACNGDGIPMALSLPEEDVDLYRARFADLCLPVFLDHELTGFHQAAGTGWTYQQMVKLCCDQTYMADNYFLVDSDFYFVRRFTRADFIDTDGTPFTFLSPHGHYADGGSTFDEARRYIGGEPARGFTPETLSALRSGRVPDLAGDLTALRPLCRETDLSAAFGHPQATYYCQSGPLFRADVLREMHGATPDRTGVAAARLIGLSPWEANWHSEFLFASDRRLSIRPMQVFHIASEAGLEQVRQAQVTEQQIATRYIAVAMAARHYDRMTLQ